MHDGVDPKEELVGVYMSQAPSIIRAYYRRLIKQLVCRRPSVLRLHFPDRGRMKETQF
jgi:hypothetical protein